MAAIRSSRRARSGDALCRAFQTFLREWRVIFCPVRRSDQACRRDEHGRAMARQRRLGAKSAAKMV